MKAIGENILVKNLTQNKGMTKKNGMLLLENFANHSKIHEGQILDIGSKVDMEDYNLKINDRVYYHFDDAVNVGDDLYIIKADNVLLIDTDND